MRPCCIKWHALCYFKQMVLYASYCSIPLIKLDILQRLKGGDSRAQADREILCKPVPKPEGKITSVSGKA